MKNKLETLINYYKENETKCDIAFFIGGVIFDIFTLSAIDDAVSIIQQILYLLIIGTLITVESLVPQGLIKIPKKWENAWQYHPLAIHFLLGSLLSAYSLFFIKSSSLFSSFLFIIFIIGIMIANEIKSLQESSWNFKWALYTLCLFCFFSMMIPTLLGFVGWIPFFISLALTVFFQVIYFSYLKKKNVEVSFLKRRVLAPGVSVISLFTLFYILGWIPPVPLAASNLGIYHLVERKGNDYQLSHERPEWRIWHSGDQEFLARPGDKIYFFAKLFSPGRFNDVVILHWYFHDPKWGWQSTDHIPMKISGGRQDGYRGFSVKQNYSEGEWRISVETTDKREIGRIYLTVKKSLDTTERIFNIDVL
ncbi:MAG: DUF2914 domain-containing protein [Bacteriovoracaceae bacterium]|nr:DUF2914 domain-containing protein [Bacteriovoracaceae bacterium]